MSKLFYAVNRETGERWEPIEGDISYLVMDDSGYLEEVWSDGHHETDVSPLCNKTWKVVFNDSMQSKIDRSGED